MERSSEDEWFRSLVNHCKKTYDKRIWERYVSNSVYLISVINGCRLMGWSWDYNITMDLILFYRVGIPHNFVMLFMGPTNNRYMAHSRAFQPGCTATVDMEEMPMEALAR